MKIETVAIETLTADPANVRKHDERNLEAIKGSLKRFGQQKPIVVDGRGIVIAGNGTLTAARSLGWTEIAIVRTDLIGPEATAFAIADNRTAELAEWDDAALAETLSALQTQDEELLAATGYDKDELSRMVDEMTEAASGPPPNMADQYGAPPFSVLDARQGYWQDRKRQWLSIGIQSELGRGEQLIPNGGGMTSKDSYTHTHTHENRHGVIQETRQTRRIPNATPGGSMMPAMDYRTGKRGTGNGKQV